MMFNKKSSKSFQEKVQGTWGSFDTPAGQVRYIQTKARLGKASTDTERRLTRHLRPVREVLPIEKMDFNQLLQRDLDDHRVAKDLLPYLLTPSMSGPAFLPPILAVLLPFEGNTPTEAFPQPSDEEILEEDGLYWKTKTYGSAFSSRLLADEDGLENDVKLGEMLWNEEHSKLVVLDGQHRAMALLAIDRTVTSKWSNSGGKYRHFYEKRVKELMGDSSVEMLDGIEVPVTVCWFPDGYKTTRNPHTAARKLFVDVNQQARKPSEARLTLLSDSELINVLTRSLLNRLREKEGTLPLYAVEYDNPDTDSSRPVRWSVLTNLTLLKMATERLVFGPKKIHRDMSVPVGGRYKAGEMNLHMREQLRVSSLFGSTIEDGDRIINRSDLTNEKFPVNNTAPMVDEFLEGWGQAVLSILGGLEPYAAHCQALSDVQDDWAADDNFSSLAREAIFSGMGMYWTLRSSSEHYRTLKDQAKKDKKPPPSEPDIVKAWQIIEQKFTDFNKNRALRYGGKSTDEMLERCKRYYGVLNTHACQLGAILAFAAVYHTQQGEKAPIAEFARRLVEAWNAALNSQRTQSEDRRFIFGRQEVAKNPLNRLGKMDTPFVIYFRYFWLEILQLEEAKAYLGEATQTAIGELATGGRKTYLRHLLKERTKSILNAEPELALDAKGRSEATKRAEKGVVEEYAAAGAHWLSMTKDEARAQAQACFAVNYESAEEPAESDDSESADDTSVESDDTQPLEDFLENIPDDD